MLSAIRLATACLLALACVTTAAAQRPEPPTIDAPADEAYVHQPSGAVFPPRIAELQRTNLHNYDPDGLNASASYRQRQPQFMITVYVYPSEGDALDEHFEQVSADIERVHTGVKLVEKRPWRLKQGGQEHVGHRAKFTIGGFGGDEREMVSELYLVKIGDWFVKYRISYPASSAPAAAKVVTGLHDAVKVPAPR